MIGYATLGVADIERAKTYYMDLFSDYGAKIVMDLGTMAFIGNGRGKPLLAVGLPYNQEPATPGNGNMIAYPASSKEEVDALYAKAMELGGTDEGKPGQRIPEQFYGAYVRDPDGNKLCFYVFG